MIVVAKLKAKKGAENQMEKELRNMVEDPAEIEMYEALAGLNR